MVDPVRPDIDRPVPIAEERWVLLEARVDQLLRRIQPNRYSEVRRAKVADYVRSLVARCFQSEVRRGPAVISTPHRCPLKRPKQLCVPILQVQAFMFGSVPLKTYLPDGDIDVAVFQSHGASVRDTWTTRLSAVLEMEARSPRTPFRVKDVQVIHAEVLPAAGPLCTACSATPNLALLHLPRSAVCCP